jgi:glycerol-3-phosphate dehydrogenase
MALLGLPRTVSTVGLAIGGGRNFPATDAAHQVWVTAHGDEIGTERAARLLARYGTRAEEVIEFLTAEPDAPLVNNAAYSRREIELLASDEFVTHLSDVVLRRTSIAFMGGMTRALGEELADVLAPLLGWTAVDRVGEVDQLVAVLRESHGVDLDGESDHQADASVVTPPTLSAA